VEELGIDHGLAGPHVGEEASVAITRFDVELEPHDPMRDERRVQPRGVAPTRSAAATRTASPGLVRDFGRIDADVTHALDTFGDPHVDGVAVVDMHHRTGEDPRGLPRRLARRRERQQQRDEYARERRRRR